MSGKALREMKKYYSLIDKVYSLKNLQLAFEKAKRKSKKVEALNLEDLAKEIKEGRYEHSQLRGILLKISGKEREIATASFKDRVVHEAYRKVLEPIYEKTFLENSFAFRKRKGIYNALEFFKRIRYRNKFVLKADIQDFFHSIDHEILMNLLKKRIADSSFLKLTEKLLKVEVLFNKQKIKKFEKKGVPLGSSISGLFANIYLHELDSFIVKNLKIKEYVRYCDDFVLLTKSRGEAIQISGIIEDFLNKNLNLKLNPEKTIMRTLNFGIPFLGYKIFPHYILLKNSNVEKFKKKVKAMRTEEELKEYLNGWFQYSKYGNTFKLHSILNNFIEKWLYKN